MANEPAPRRPPTEAIARERDAELYKTIRTGIRTIGTVISTIGISYFASKVFGTTTDFRVNGVISFFADLRFIASVALTGSALAYALQQRSARKRTVRQLAPYKEKYERMLDPNRTGSDLTTSGTTNPSDVGP